MGAGVARFCSALNFWQKSSALKPQDIHITCFESSNPIGKCGVSTSIRVHTICKEGLQQNSFVCCKSASEVSRPWRTAKAMVKPSEGEPPLSEKLIQGLEKAGIENLLPIQVETWKALSGGARRVFDLRICSPTGSGKTLAYALPVLQQAVQSIGQISTFDNTSGHAFGTVSCIVLLPTRDLAQQVHGVFETLAKVCGVRVGLAAGLASLEEEAAQYELNRELQGPLYSDLVSILVATPGRLRSHLDRKGMNLLGLKFLVFDEMDRLLQQSYNECIPVLLEQQSTQQAKHVEAQQEKLGAGLSFMTPNYKCIENRVVKLSVSATISSDSSKTAKLKEGFVRTVTSSSVDLNLSSGLGTSGNPKKKNKYQIPDSLEERKVICSKEKKPFTLIDLLKKVEKQPTVCFTNSTEASDLIYTLLSKTESVDWRCESYNSKKTKQERIDALQKFKAREIDLLIASDALSRGIDLPKVKLVINYDMPTSTKNYVHRVGRTARVGEEGLAISILIKEDVVHFKHLIKKLNHRKFTDIKMMRVS